MLVVYRVKQPTYRKKHETPKNDVSRETWSKLNYTNNSFSDTSDT